MQTGRETLWIYKFSKQSTNFFNNIHNVTLTIFGNVYANVASIKLSNELQYIPDKVDSFWVLLVRCGLCTYLLHNFMQIISTTTQLVSCAVPTEIMLGDPRYIRKKKKRGWGIKVHFAHWKKCFLVDTLLC